MRDIDIRNVCYVGDDINDIDATKTVGFGCYLADAMTEVKKVSQYVTKEKGGEGVAREIVEMNSREV